MNLKKKKKRLVTSVKGKARGELMCIGTSRIFVVHLMYSDNVQFQSLFSVGG